MSLQFFAPAGVKPARDKKERDDGEVDEVSHGFCFKLRALGARLSQPQQIENPKTLRYFVRSFGNPGCCGHPRSVPFAR